MNNVHLFYPAEKIQSNFELCKQIHLLVVLEDNEIMHFKK